MPFKWWFILIYSKILIQKLYVTAALYQLREINWTKIHVNVFLRLIKFHINWKLRQLNTLGKKAGCFILVRNVIIKF